MKLNNQKASILMKLLIVIIIIAVLVVIAFSFYNSNNADPDARVNIVPIRVAVSPLTLTLNVNKTQQFVATVYPLDADRSVIWSVSDPLVGTIDGDGLFVAIASGTTNVTATSTANADIFGAATITVIKVPAIEKTPSNLNVTLKQGGIMDITIRVKNVGGGNLYWTKLSNVDWITGLPKEGISTGEWDSTIVTINATGLGVGVHKGEITFSAIGVNFQTTPIILTVE